MTNNEGKRFEEDFKKSCKDLLFYRFQDSNKFGFGEQTRFTMQSPCDCFIFDYPYLFFLELKSTKGTSLSFALEKDKEDRTSYNIKPHQIKSLLKFKQHEGVFAGFLINLRARQTKQTKRENATYYLDIHKFMDLATEENKKSISEKEIIKHGVEVEGRMMKVRYRYDVQKLLHKLTQNVC